MSKKLKRKRTPEEKAQWKKHHEEYLARKHRFDYLPEDTQDETFAYIAGDTSGGVSFGLRWEDVGIDPSLPLEKKQYLFDHMYDSPDEGPIKSDDLPF